MAVKEWWPGQWLLMRASSVDDQTHAVIRVCRRFMIKRVSVPALTFPSQGLEGQTGILCACRHTFIINMRMPVKGLQAQEGKITCIGLSFTISFSFHKRGIICWWRYEMKLEMERQPSACDESWASRSLIFPFFFIDRLQKEKDLRSRIKKNKGKFKRSYARIPFLSLGSSHWRSVGQN